MKKILVIFIVLTLVATSIQILTANKISQDEIDCLTCDKIVKYVRPDGSECSCLLLEGKYAVMSELPPKSEEILKITIQDPQPTMATNDLPSAFSWTNFGGDWTTSAKDQANCGSCWAFGALGVLEAGIDIASGNPNLNIDLSEQYVLSCLKSSGSCSGGWMSEALYCIRSTAPGNSGNGINGVTIESCMPYQAKDYIPCDDKCDDWDYYTLPPEEDNKLWQILDMGVTTFPNWNTQDAWDTLKSWVFTYGPITVDIYASNSWSNYWSTHHSPTDVYEGSESSTTNHAQLLCGWVDDPNVKNGGYWILKNSWGTSWGYNGFNNLAYGCLRLGNRDVAWATTTEWPQSGGDDPQAPDPSDPIYYVYSDWQSLPNYPKPGTQIEFIDKSRGPVVLWEWDFDGDGIFDISGSNSAAKRPKWTYTQDGVYEVTQQVWSSAGLKSTLTRKIEVKQVWPPVAVSSPAYYGGNNPTVSFDGRNSYDIDGTIIKYEWDFNGDGSIDSTEPYNTYKYPDTNGEYTASLTVTDNDEAKSKTDILVKIDKSVPPVTTAFVGGIGENNDNWFNDNVKVDLEATDWSGVSWIYYRVNGQDWKSVYCNNALSYVFDKLTITESGSNTIEFYSVDKYGNTESIKTVNVNIDRITPVLDYTIDGTIKDGIYISAVTITVNANDAGSGIEFIKYKIDYSEWTDYTSPFTIAQGGTRTIYLLTADKAGNYADLFFSVTLDYGPSKPSINGPVQGKPNVEYEYSFTSTDVQYDKVSYFVEWGDGSTSGWSEYVDSGNSVKFKHTWSEEKTFIIRAKARNIRGAEGDWSTFSVSMPRSRFLIFRDIMNRLPIFQNFFFFFLNK